MREPRVSLLERRYPWIAGLFVTALLASGSGIVSAFEASACIGPGLMIARTFMDLLMMRDHQAEMHTKTKEA